jgi:hypothetical protein
VDSLTIMELVAAFILMFTGSPTYTHKAYDIGVEFSQEEKESIVYKSVGEAGKWNQDGVSGVIATIMCRVDRGYGSVDDIMSAYYAPFVKVDKEYIDRVFHTECRGARYALSYDDIEYLRIPVSEPRICVEGTCFFLEWVDNR